MKEKVTAIFDIGKTNKKFFLFNRDYQEVFREDTQLDEIEDDEGYPAEDLKALQRWMYEVLERNMGKPEFDIKALNFSAYGASLVHLDAQGKVVAPLYNYTKPLDVQLEKAFFEQYGPLTEFAVHTGSSPSGMLNSGFQLYWIKHCKPDIYRLINKSLHLPQYASFLFTGLAKSDYTSIGCHTGLWDYAAKDYHPWVGAEGILNKLAPIAPASSIIEGQFLGKPLRIGVGIHDSSAALIPYLKSETEPFLLISTGTWSVSVNPKAHGLLTERDIEEDCLYYMQSNGDPVRASRIFLGWEYQQQVKRLAEYFGRSPETHIEQSFNPEIYRAILQNYRPLFYPAGSEANEKPPLKVLPYKAYEAGYHHLMLELVHWQLKSIRSALGGTSIKMAYLEGGFCNNDVFVQILAHQLGDIAIFTSASSQGSAIGAAMVISDGPVPFAFLEKVNPITRQYPKNS